MYVFFAWLYLARGASLTHCIFGSGADPFIFIWALAWWPWAVAHHLPLLHTDLLWQPEGVFTFWITSVPLLAAVMAPVTLLAGPVVSYNLLVVAAPVLSAGAMYGLCRRLGLGFAAAWLGGYLFGFSSYQMAQASALNLAFTVFVPALGWVVVARWRRDLGRLAAVAMAALCLVGQFLVSIEVFALLVLFGAMLCGVAVAMVAAWRARLVELAAEGAAAGAVAAAVLAPALASMFSHLGFLHLPALWAAFFDADLFATVAPSARMLLGGAWSHVFINGFFGDSQEQDSYFGLPLVLMLYGFARRNWQDAAIGWLAVGLAVVTVLSWGPALWVVGRYTGWPMPWAVLVHVPLLRDLLPARFALAAWFIAALLAGLWLQGDAGPAGPGQAGPGPTGRRVVWAGLICLLLLPAGMQRQTMPDSAFFAPGRVQAALGPNPQILVLPFAINGPAQYWQVENRFGFRMTGGYLGFPPAAAQRFPAVQELFGGRPEDFVAADFSAFARATGTRFVVAGPGTPAALMRRLEGLGWPARRVDDVTVFSVPGGKAS